MIISASRRTDIPAFYSEWFINRVKEGYFEKVNPFNPTQRKMVSLHPRDVDLFVFWSKHPEPLFEFLPELDGRGYRYYFLYTLNCYPELLEPKLPGLKQRIDTFKRLSELIGADKIIWRYDPIVISNHTPVAYHLENFRDLAEVLKGFTSRVIVSFFDIYPKLRQAFFGLEKCHGLKVIELRDGKHEEELETLVQGLSATAKSHNLAITSCAEKLDLCKYGADIKHGSCIDAGYIYKVFGLNLKLKKDPSQRPECRCVQSADMGVYDTCKFGCVYCYASSGRKGSKEVNPECQSLIINR